MATTQDTIHSRLGGEVQTWLFGFFLATFGLGMDLATVVAAVRLNMDRAGAGTTTALVHSTTSGMVLHAHTWIQTYSGDLYALGSVAIIATLVGVILLFLGELPAGLAE